MDQSPIFTIGYGARDIDQFLATLQQYEIAYLIDVRSRPYSRYKPDFSKDNLEAHLRWIGVRYVYMGDSLGGLPADRDCYDTDGKVDYHKVGEKQFYRDGLARLAKAYSQGLRLTLMCSEGKPELCHRSKLIGKSLKESGVPVAHIDENDRVIEQEEVGLRLTGGQPSLFGDDLLPSGSRKRYELPEDEGDE
ncbi:MAG: DUF488 domain-containing protein [Chloroflexota bacterium]|jgi:uncharacterized protein (DUF488 family)